MIGYIEGTILHFNTDGILLLAGNIGYEILLNPQVVAELRSLDASDTNISLYIYYHQTERQPKPVLIGFKTLEDKNFFQTFITVDAIGPMKAIKAMSQPIGQMANAIEKKDVTFLTALSGIGKRTAQKIIATLNGKVEKFIAVTDHEQSENGTQMSDGIPHIGQQVEDVLVEQLGHSQASAKRMIKEALERDTTISTPEELFDVVFQENK
ncbi:MAG: Holliday junction DNA helicase RuvA [Desulfobacula sp.]|nr:Holliday junction DNA helicase RuvA [Desulfobacula sp.]